MNFQNFINSRLAIGLALGFGRVIPPFIGYRAAAIAASWLASRKDWPMVQALRANQWVVSDGKLSSSQLDQAVKKTFRHTARGIYDLYHNINNRAAMERLINFNSRIEDGMKMLQEESEGLVIVIPHMSNYDFVGRAAAMRGWRSLVIGFHQPSGGYQWQNQLREGTGVELLPASPATFRRCIRHLQAGGSVMTGLDRPFPDLKLRVRFFGRPAPLPTAHVYMALKAKVPVVVIAPVLLPDGRYHILASEFITMQPHPDRDNIPLELW